MRMKKNVFTGCLDDAEQAYKDAYEVTKNGETTGAKVDLDESYKACRDEIKEFRDTIIDEELKPTIMHYKEDAGV